MNKSTRPFNPADKETIFYDGECGLCHGAVRFTLSQDRSGKAFRFAPLNSDAFRKDFEERERKKLPDSIVIRTIDGRVLTRSDAVFHILFRLGGFWRALAAAGRLMPRCVTDLMYDGVAAVRKKLFAKPPAACPLLPAHLRNRFRA